MPESLISVEVGSKPFSFKENEEAQRVARDYALNQSQVISGQTKRAIRRLIVRSIREGIPPREAALLIKGDVGLNEMQEKAVFEYRGRLDPSMSVSQREKAVKKFQMRLLRRRAVMIARTEVIDALNTGAEVAWKQAQKQGYLGKNAKKEWVAELAGACEVCRALHGDSVKLDGNFTTIHNKTLKSPTAHPNCRCSIAPVP